MSLRQEIVDYNHLSVRLFFSPSPSFRRVELPFFLNSQAQFRGCKCRGLFKQFHITFDKSIFMFLQGIVGSRAVRTHSSTDGDKSWLKPESIRRYFFLWMFAQRLHTCSVTLSLVRTRAHLSLISFSFVSGANSVCAHTAVGSQEEVCSKSICAFVRSAVQHSKLACGERMSGTFSDREITWNVNMKTKGIDLGSRANSLMHTSLIAIFQLMRCVCAHVNSSCHHRFIYS